MIITRQLELNDDKANIDNIIDEVINQNKTISIYTDYRDFDNLPYIIKTLDNVNELIEELIRMYDEEVCFELQEIEDKVIQKLILTYGELFSNISYSLREYISLRVMEEVEVNYPVDEFLNAYVKVNIVITFNDSYNAETYDFDYKTLYHLLKKLGYKKPMTILKSMLDGEYKDGEDKFLNSLNNEIINAYTGQYNFLTFVGNVKIKDYFNLIDKTSNTTIELDGKHYGGFFDMYNGGGSVFGITLPKPLKVNSKDIRMVLLEDDKQSQTYTVKDVYGLSRKCYQDIDCVEE